MKKATATAVEIRLSPDAARQLLFGEAPKLTEEQEEKILLAVSRFREGDKVRWYESPAFPENRGEVLEGPTLIGFPESLDGPGIGYLVEFPGAMGVGREEYPMGEEQLMPYGEEE